MHSALGCSTFEALHGRKPRTLGIIVHDAVPYKLSSWLHERSIMQELLHQHLVRAQDRMKRQAGKKRSERTFAVGNWVYLRLQPYVQASVMPRAHHKLSFKFFCPLSDTSSRGTGGLPPQFARYQSYTRKWCMCLN
jgi:hypothetical protein